MKSLFVPGDIIVCIDDSKQSIVKKGEQYTVRLLDGKSRVGIEEHKRFTYLIKRFELVGAM